MATMGNQHMASFLPSKFIPKGRARVRLILVVVAVVALFAAVLDYPSAYNAVAVRVNNALDKFDMPGAIEKLDTIGVFATIDNVARLPESERTYSLGLDLQGGVRLVYQADLSGLDLQEQQDDAVNALRDVVERRVNFLGVREPIVQVERDARGGARLLVELAGIQDPQQAIDEIGETPLLEFKEVREEDDYVARVLKMAPNVTREDAVASCLNAIGIQTLNTIRGITKSEDPCFVPTELTGRYLDSARVVTDPTTGQLQIALQFDDRGADLFEELTGDNIGKPIAIVLDGAVVSAPIVNTPITGGQAVITGGFTLAQARDIASNLNAGALPVPISIISQQQIGATLGEDSVAASLRAGVIGVLAVMVFMILLYRVSGLVAVISLTVYISLLLALIQLIPVTLTLAGIAGLILSVGMAVDANILVFERLREELKGGREHMGRAVENAFARTWPAVRDGNVSTLLTAIILFYFSTSFVQGFALTLGLGVLVSMFSAMVVTRSIMVLLAETKFGSYKRLWTRLLRI